MAKNKRKIIHIDLDAFFCAVEEKNNPALIGTPFAVGGSPQERGVVSSCSYAAREFGVRSAMSMHRAIMLYPELKIIKPNYKEYSRFSASVMQRLQGLTPLFEQLSIDEAFLDVSDLPDPGLLIGKKIHQMITQDIGLPCSIGIAGNKLVAKIATDVGKQNHLGVDPPNAITEVSLGTEEAFLAPLPVQNLWGIGPKTTERLKREGIITIGDLVAAPLYSLTPIFGRFTHEIIERARGIDNKPVEVTHEIKSISQETTFARDVSHQKIIKQTLWRLSETVGVRLREQQLCANTIKIKLRWANFTTISRQVTLQNPTDQDRNIFESASLLLEKAWDKRKPIRLIGVGVTKLSLPARQLSFWDDYALRNQQLQITMDIIRKKYGKRIIQMGGGMEFNEE